MPEGDVLRRTAAELGAALDGTVLTRVELRWPSAPTDLLVGDRLLTTAAYGKHLLQRFESGWTLRTHLRMDGSWRVQPQRQGPGRVVSGAARSPAARAVLGNDRWLAVGVRLGMLDVVRTRDEPRLLGHLGPDLLAEDFLDVGLPVALENLHREPHRPVCEALLDQTVVAGIGTIYTAESLFAHQLWPWTPVASLPGTTPADLLTTARRLMQRVVLGGYTARTSHVHGREGKGCHRCGALVARGTARKPPYERPVFWCPQCQPPVS